MSDSNENRQNGMQTMPDNTIDAEYDKIVSMLPEDLRAAIIAGKALLPSFSPNVDYESYLDARDEHIVEEKLVRVGANGSTKLVVVSVETSRDQREKMNFPKYKMNKRISDYI